MGTISDMSDGYTYLDCTIFVKRSAIAKDYCYMSYYTTWVSCLTAGNFLIHLALSVWEIK